MVGEGRRSAGFGDALEGFNSDEWAPKEKPAKPRPDRAETQASAELVGFKSREPAKPAAAEKAPAASNRRRTGRTDQHNIRMTPETKQTFKAIAAKMDWSEAVAFEKAVALLEKQCGR